MGAFVLISVSAITLSLTIPSVIARHYKNKSDRLEESVENLALILTNKVRISKLMKVAFSELPCKCTKAKELKKVLEKTKDDIELSLVLSDLLTRWGLNYGYRY